LTLPTLALGAAVVAATVAIALGLKALTYKPKFLNEIEESTKGFQRIRDSLKETRGEILQTKKVIEDDDWLARMVNFLSVGGLERKIKNESKIKFGENFQTANNTAQEVFISQQEANKLVEDAIALQQKLGALKLEAMQADLQNKPADEKIKIQKQIQETQSKLTDTTSKISKTEQLKTDLETLINSDNFKDFADEATKLSFTQLLKDVNTLDIRAKEIQKQLSQDASFTTRIKIDQSELEGIKADAIKIRAELDLKSAQDQSRVKQNRFDQCLNHGRSKLINLHKKHSRSVNL
jgi:hypothetical protein